MRFESETTYEVWAQVGGFNPSVCVTRLTKAQAEEQVKEWTQFDRDRRPEAAPVHYMVVAATTTRREVH